MARSLKPEAHNIYHETDRINNGEIAFEVRVDSYRTDFSFSFVVSYSLTEGTKLVARGHEVYRSLIDYQAQRIGMQVADLFRAIEGGASVEVVIQEVARRQVRNVLEGFGQYSQAASYAILAEVR